MTAGRRWSLRLALGVVLMLGIQLRLRSLDQSALFIDEGESSLNALSILAHGYPADHYLGLPMFENTLTEPWPESAEYEFRDTSYSSRGMAIYHGWLPLYAIALSQALHGIRPDERTDPPRVQHGESEIRRRIRAARLPAVAFGALFLVLVFLTGRLLFGVDAGLAALLLAAFAPKCIWLAQQARYYSAGLALSTLAVYAAWRLHRHGRWRDALAAGIAFVLLFHTSSLAFAIVLVPCALLLPGVFRAAQGRTKLAAGALVVALGIGPWILWTGYLEHGVRIPLARSYLDFPDDYFVYLGGRTGRVLLAGLIVLFFGAIWHARRRLAPRLAALVAGAGLPVLFAVVWILSAYFGFQVLVPAASCSMARLSHVLIAGPILLGSIGIALLARVVLPRHASALSAAAAAVVLAVSGGEPQQANPFETRAVFELVGHLRTQQFQRDTRIYALPYQHFCLTYYTGLPVQSIAPVRAEFLANYSGEVLILETVHRLPPPPPPVVQRLARERGVALDPVQAREWSPILHQRMTRAEVEPLVRELAPALAAQPEWVDMLVADLRREAEQSGRGRFDYALDNPAMFPERSPLTIDEFWPAFFYRFVGPEQRTGVHLNYAGRMRTASALLLPSSWIVLRCPQRVQPQD